MPLKRSSSMAMPYAGGGKSESSRKGFCITACSAEEWAATLAMLSNMPRAQYTRRPHRNSDSESSSNSRSKSRDHSRHRSASDGKERSGSSSGSDSFSSHSKRSTSSGRHKDHRHHQRQSAASAAAAAAAAAPAAATPSRNPSSSKSSSREVHVKALGELQTATARLPHPEVVYGAMIPEPDYSDDEREATVTKQAALISRNNQVNASSPAKKEKDVGEGNKGRMDENGLIMPKKLVNPCLESTEKKSLHRELLYNQKRGVSVLNQKTELQKAMEKHNDKKVLKEIQKEKEAALTPFQKALDERAQRIEQLEKAETKDVENEKDKCEFQKIHAKVRAKMEVQ